MSLLKMVSMMSCSFRLSIVNWQMWNRLIKMAPGAMRFVICDRFTEILLEIFWRIFQKYKFHISCAFILLDRCLVLLLYLYICMCVSVCMYIIDIHFHSICS